MGRYRSKKENIQEANRLLEKRLIVEEHDGQWANMQTFKTDQENPTETNSDEQIIGGEKTPIETPEPILFAVWLLENEGSSISKYQYDDDGGIEAMTNFYEQFKSNKNGGH